MDVDVGLAERCESSELIDVVLVLPIFTNDRCFGEHSREPVAIFSLNVYLYIN